MNFNLHFDELHSDNSINDKNILFENYIPKCYKVKRILISFNCFSEYIRKYNESIYLLNNLFSSEKTEYRKYKMHLKRQLVL